MKHVCSSISHRLTAFAVMLFTLAIAIPTYSQENADTLGAAFGVAGFRKLPNDVTAFISPVYDLNGEACALVKVVSPDEFVFSTPLGIVSRVDKTGEIWLYMPKGTKSLTIKHPQLGVLRDYRLRPRLESRVTYELRLTVSQQPPMEIHDTIVMTKTVTDTIRIEHRRPHIPLASYVMLTSSFHRGGPSWGLLAALVWRHGFYVHASSDLRSTGSTTLTCDKQGHIDGSAELPYYTGQTRQSNYTVTAGAVHRLNQRLCLFEGVGYGRTATAWQLSQSDGGGYALNDGLTHKGVSGELGVIASIGRLSLAASVITIAAKQWQGSIGVGIKLGKQ